MTKTEQIIYNEARIMWPEKTEAAVALLITACRSGNDLFAKVEKERIEHGYPDKILQLVARLALTEIVLTQELIIFFDKKKNESV